MHEFVITSISGRYLLKRASRRVAIMVTSKNKRTMGLVISRRYGKNDTYMFPNLPPK